MSIIDFSRLRDPEYYMENRLPAHSDHVVSRNETERSLERSSLRKCLNGVWKFHHALNPGMAPEGFEQTSYDCSGWEDIRVPAHIQMEGYGVPQYSNTSYPWDGHEWVLPGDLPGEFNPTASYVTWFEVPREWEGQPVLISFQGVESGFALWLNGHYVGYSEDTFDASDFDLTPYICEGSNKLAVQVYRFTASSWAEDQDFYRFSGIFRDVYLYTEQRTHVWDVKAEAIPCFDEEDRAVSGHIHLAFKAKGQGTVYVQLFAAQENVLHYTSAALRRVDMLGVAEAQIADGSAVLEFDLQEVTLWSAEHPALYTAYVQVKEETGDVTEVFTQRLGFRSFEMIGGIMCLNKKRIVFKGVNRHEFSSVVGRVPVYQDMLQDITTMKQHNINALRTSHYPDCSVVYDDGCWKRGIYEMCDVMGLYMIAENNMETHGTWEVLGRKQLGYDFVVPGDKAEFGAMLLDRIDSLYQTYKNHTSIIIWSMGNESFGGPVIRDMAMRMRSLDSTRLIHYEGIHWDDRYPETSDMESQMYTPVTKIEEFLSEEKDKPFLLCEYTHAMGNSCGGMHLYTALADREPRFQGGFIWDYIDQSIYKKDRYGKEFLAYGGDFGERPTDYEFSGNGICYGGERLPSPKMQDVKYNYQYIYVTIEDRKNFTVTNKSLFTGTGEFDAWAILLADGAEIAREALPDIAVGPQQSASFKLPEIFTGFMAEDFNREYAVTVSFTLKEDTIWAKAGHEVAFGQKVYKKQVLPYSCPGQVVEGSRGEGRHGQLEFVCGTNNYGVRGEHFSAIFGRNAIGLTSYVYGGKEMLPWIPRPNFWRAPVCNDDGNLMQLRYAQWKIASLYVSTKTTERFQDTSPIVEMKDSSICFTYTYYMPTLPASKCSLCYEVFADGTIQTTLSYDPVKELGDMPEFGLMFKLDADYDLVKWYGLGPEESYTDRLEGAKLGVYENRVADNMAAYLTPQECGNHCGVRRLRVTDRKGRGMEFTGDELSVNVLPYTPHELENAAHDYELPRRHYTVVRVARQQMGVGGDDSWGAKVHPRYLIDTEKKLEFTFCFRGI